jgi:hypothetical protein
MKEKAKSSPNVEESAKETEEDFNFEELVSINEISNEDLESDEAE